MSLTTSIRRLAIAWSAIVAIHAADAAPAVPAAEPDARVERRTTLKDPEPDARVVRRTTTTQGAVQGATGTWGADPQPANDTRVNRTGTKGHVDGATGAWIGDAPATTGILPGTEAPVKTTEATKKP